MPTKKIRQKKKPKQITDKKQSFENRCTKLQKFLEDFFLDASYNFKVHKFSEKGFEKPQLFSEGHDVNINKALTFFSGQKLLQCQAKKQVLSFTPNVFKINSSANEINLTHFNALFVDIDNYSDQVDFKTLEFEPHFILSRPKVKKFHLYWLLKPIKATENNRKKYLALQKYFCDILGGDFSTIATVRLMRLPYTSHNKENIVSHYRITQQNEYLDRYNLAELFEALEHLIKPDNVKLEDTEVVKIIKRVIEVHRIVSKGQGRTNFIHYIGCLCFEWGIEKEKAIVLVNEIQKEKCDPPESLKHVEVQIEKVYLHNKKEFGFKLNDYENSKSYEQRKKFLSYENHLGSIRNYMSNWVYVNQAELWINVDTNIQFTTRQQLNAFLLRKFNVNDPWQVILKNGLVLSVDKITIDPDRELKIFLDGGISFFNRYKKIDIDYIDLGKTNAKPKQRKAVALFLSHLRYLVPQVKARHLFLQFLCYIIQHPGKKVMWAPVIVSDHKGVGKSILYLLFQKIFKDFVGSVDNSILNYKETDYLVNCYLLFIHELSHGNKFVVANRLRTMITDPKVSIVMKYARTYEQPNITNFILYANGLDDLALEENDRRFLIIHNTLPPKNQKYYDKLVKVLTENAKEIYSYLKTYDLKNFNPYKRPMDTEAKLTMTSLSKNEIDIYLESLFDEKADLFNNDIVIIQNAMKTLSDTTFELKKGLSQKAIRRFLLRKQYSERIIHVNGKTRRLWSNCWGRIDKERNTNNKYLHNLVEDLLDESKIFVKTERDYE